MSDDHRALIEEARASHSPGRNVLNEGCCGYCEFRWPCLTARLADALETKSERYDVMRFDRDYCRRQSVATAADREAVFARLAQAEAERDDLRGHYDAVREQVGVVTERLAAARVALEKYGKHPSECSAWRTVYWKPPLECDCGLVAALAPCASCGQDPAGGHNLGCPDGAGL